MALDTHTQSKPSRLSQPDGVVASSPNPQEGGDFVSGEKQSSAIAFGLSEAVCVLSNKKNEIDAPAAEGIENTALAVVLALDGSDLLKVYIK